MYRQLMPAACSVPSKHGDVCCTYLGLIVWAGAENLDKVTLVHQLQFCVGEKEMLSWPEPRTLDSCTRQPPAAASSRAKFPPSSPAPTLSRSPCQTLRAELFEAPVSFDSALHASRSWPRSHRCLLCSGTRAPSQAGTSAELRRGAEERRVGMRSMRYGEFRGN